MNKLSFNVDWRYWALGGGIHFSKFWPGVEIGLNIGPVELAFRSWNR